MAFNVGVLVELLRGGDVGVSENQLGIPGGNAQILQQRRGAVPDVMNRYPRQPGVFTDLMKRPDEVLGIDWCPCLAGENQSVGQWPVRGHGTGLWIKSGPLGGFGQSGPHRGDEGQIPATGSSLHRSLGEDAADSLQLLADMKPILVEVHVAPAESEDFTPAHPVDAEGEVGAEPGRVFCCFQELSDLLRSPGADLLALPAGHVHKAGDISGDELFADGPVQGGAQYGSG